MPSAASQTSDSSGIALDAATFAVDGRTILGGITLTLTERRIAVLGRNGSGKTTLLRLIAGLIAPTAGSVRVDGIDPFRDRRAILSRVGILFQNPDRQIIFPTVGEELAFGLRQAGRTATEARAEVTAQLAAHGRSRWIDAPVAALSQGQKQFVCLLAVLLLQPATLLLDEPFSGLDLPTLMRMRRRLDGLPQRLVTITHDPLTAAAAERVVWIEAGRVHDEGPPSRVVPAFEAAMRAAGETDADADITL